MEVVIFSLLFVILVCLVSVFAFTGIIAHLRMSIYLFFLFGSFGGQFTIKIMYFGVKYHLDMSSCDSPLLP